ncbi:TIR-like protein FxsC [Phytohabitans rumicis]|uniref:TIR-like protein FxsC n=1 Tax=Phytohabitans rumicis TaxID=1076125 RepID=UPI0015666AD0|nr:TIR-like protein FxsC [Phytohabitans rumicis]
MATGERSHAPVFFLSYAQAATRSLKQNRERNLRVMEFFDELSEHVSGLLGLRAGEDPGFMDRTMTGGQRWTRELLHAAGTCQVFVPLVSPGLVRSPWCAMEWDAFSRREIVRRDDGGPAWESGILPVSWIQTEYDVLPAVVREIQHFAPIRLPNPDYAADYQQEGLYGLLALKSDAYSAVVWRLAQRIVEVYRTHRVTHLVPSGTDSLRNVFTEKEEVA